MLINFKKYVDFKPQNVYEWHAIQETIKPDTVLFLETPDMVYLGPNASLEKNINIDFCKKNNISIVRGIYPGKSYYYREGDALFLVLSTIKKVETDVINYILLRAFKNLLPDIFLEDNDIRLGNKRIAMVGKSVQDYDHYIINAEIKYDIDFESIKEIIQYHSFRWFDKPVRHIDEWILTLKELNISREQIKQEIIKVLELYYNTKIEKRELYDVEKLTPEIIEKYKNRTISYTKN